MRYFLLTAALMFLCSSAFAQIKPRQDDWFAYDFGYNHLLGGTGELVQEWYSNSHSISVTDDVIFGNSNFGMAYGLGFMSNNYHTNIGISTSLSTGAENFVFLDRDTLEGNKFTIQHLYIPLELRFRSDRNEEGNFFRIYVGGRMGLRIKSYSETETDKATIQYRKLDSMNEIHYGVYTRIGYGFVSLYAYYGLSEIFERGYVQESTGVFQPMSNLRPLTVGLSFSL